MAMTPEAVIINELTAGIGKGVCVDIGAREIEGSNVAPLIFERGWRGVLFEASANRCRALIKPYKGYPVTIYAGYITTQNVNHAVPKDADVLNIDIDGQDWHVWNELKSRPAVVCIEYNPGKSGHYVMPRIEPYNWKKDFDRTRYGASRDAMVKLGESKGYRLHAETGHNLIFEKER
jgi:hypothetical protein